MSPWEEQSREGETDNAGQKGDLCKSSHFVNNSYMYAFISTVYFSQEFFSLVSLYFSDINIEPEIY